MFGRRLARRLNIFCRTIIRHRALLRPSGFTPIGIRLKIPLGVPEVWWYDAHKLRIYQLPSNGDYAPQVRSPTFPFLPIEDMERFLVRHGETDGTARIRSFREWVKTLGR